MWTKLLLKKKNIFPISLIKKRVMLPKTVIGLMIEGMEIMVFNEDLLNPIFSVLPKNFNYIYS